jgi:hypothetical protein
MSNASESSDNPSIHQQLELLMQFWDVYDETGESGQTSRETLDGLRAKVNDCFHRGPSALAEAMSLTAEAMLLMMGDSD